MYNKLLAMKPTRSMEVGDTSNAGNDSLPSEGIQGKNLKTPKTQKTRKGRRKIMND